MPTTSNRLLGIGLLLALAFGGCTCSGSNITDPGGDAGTDGGHPDGGHPDGSVDAGDTDTTLSLAPQDAVLTTDGTSAVSQAYTATAHHSDGTTEDVTSLVSFDLDDARLGAFSGSTFQSATYGGTAHVSVKLGLVSASTSVSVKVSRRYPDPGAPGAALPSDPSSAFGGAAATANLPDVVYPNSGVLLPPNLSKLEFHFKPGAAANKLFELSFSNAVTDLKVYTRCTVVGAGCVYLPDANVWRWLAETNRGGSAVTVGLRAVDDSVSGGQVGSATAITLSFAPEDVNGALYYWTTTSKSIQRFAFGVPDAGPSTFADPTTVTGGDSTCVGCHALSRDGTKLVAESKGQSGGQLAMLNVSDQTAVAAYGSNDKSIFESWNPAGTFFAGVYGDSSATDYNLHIHDGVTGKIVDGGVITGTGTASRPADHPDWSPYGDKIVYTRVGVSNTNQKSGMGGIQMVTFNGTSWSAPVTLVPAANLKNHYYPAFAPDQSFIVYDQSTCPAGVPDGGWLQGSQYGDNATNKTLGTEDCNMDSDPTATLFALPLDGGTAVPLTALNAPGKLDGATTALSNSFPKWSPFIGKSASGGKLMWITFSSVRTFGLKPNGASGGRENPTTQRIWMAAIDPSKLASGQDPSYPAFFLPYQDPATSNHIAQWAETLVDHCEARNGTCGNDGDCCSGMSCYALEGSQGTCQPPGVCAGAGAACGGSVGCCSGTACLNGAGSTCVAGQSCTCGVLIQ